MSASDMTMEINVEGLSRRAAVFQFLGAACRYPDMEHKRGLLEAASRLCTPGAWMSWPITVLAGAWAEVGRGQLVAAHDQLFGNEGELALKETNYATSDRAAELADINAFYLAFGFAQPERHRSLPDGLGAQLEFYSLLLRTLANTCREYWHGRFEVTRDAAQEFLAGHLGRWVRAARDRALRLGVPAEYRCLLDAVVAAVEEECALQDVAVKAVGAAPGDARRGVASVTGAGGGGEAKPESAAPA